MVKFCSIGHYLKANLDLRLAPVECGAKKVAFLINTKAYMHWHIIALVFGHSMSSHDSSNIMHCTCSFRLEMFAVIVYCNL